MTLEEFKSFTKSPLYQSFKIEMLLILNEDNNRFMRYACEKSVQTAQSESGLDIADKGTRFPNDVLDNPSNLSIYSALNQARLLAEHLNMGADIVDGEYDEQPIADHLITNEEYQEAHNTFERLMKLKERFNSEFERISANPEEKARMSVEDRRTLDLGKNLFDVIDDWNNTISNNSFSDEDLEYMNNYNIAKKDFGIAQDTLKEELQKLSPDLTFAFGNVGELDSNGQPTETYIDSKDILKDISLVTDTNRLRSWGDALTKRENDINAEEANKLSQQEGAHQKELDKLQKSHEEKLSALAQNEKTLNDEIEKIQSKHKGLKPFDQMDEYIKLINDANEFKNIDTSDISKEYVKLGPNSAMRELFIEDDIPDCEAKIADVNAQIMGAEVKLNEHQKQLEDAENELNTFVRDHDEAVRKAEEWSASREKIAEIKAYLDNVNEIKTVNGIDDGACVTPEIKKKKFDAQQHLGIMNDTHKAIKENCDFAKTAKVISKLPDSRKKLDKLVNKNVVMPWDADENNKYAVSAADFDALSQALSDNKPNMFMNKLSDLNDQMQKREALLNERLNMVADNSNKANKSIRDALNEEKNAIKKVKSMLEPISADLDTLKNSKDKHEQLMLEIDTDIREAYKEEVKKANKLKEEARQASGLKGKADKGEVLDDDNAIIEAGRLTDQTKELKDKVNAARALRDRDKNDIAFLNKKKNVLDEAKKWFVAKQNDPRNLEKNKLEDLNRAKMANDKLIASENVMYNNSKEQMETVHKQAVSEIKEGIASKREDLQQNRESLKAFVKATAEISKATRGVKEKAAEFNIRSEEFAMHMDNLRTEHAQKKTTAFSAMKANIIFNGNLFKESKKSFGIDSQYFKDVVEKYDAFKNEMRGADLSTMNASTWNEKTKPLLESINEYIKQRQDGFELKKTEKGQIRLDLAIKLRNQLESTRTKACAIQDQTDFLDRITPSYAEPKTSVELQLLARENLGYVFNENVLNDDGIKKMYKKETAKDNRFFLGETRAEKRERIAREKQASNNQPQVKEEEKKIEPIKKSDIVLGNN